MTIVLTPNIKTPAMTRFRLIHLPMNSPVFRPWQPVDPSKVAELVEQFTRDWWIKNPDKLQKIREISRRPTDN